MSDSEGLEEEFISEYQCAICHRWESLQNAVSVCKVLENRISFKDEGHIWIYCHCKKLYHLSCLLHC